MRRKKKNPVKDLLKQPVSLGRESRTWGELSIESLEGLTKHKDVATAFIANKVLELQRQKQASRYAHASRKRRKGKIESSGPGRSSLSARGASTTKEPSRHAKEGVSGVNPD